MPSRSSCIRTRHLLAWVGILPLVVSSSGCPTGRQPLDLSQLDPVDTVVATAASEVLLASPDQVGPDRVGQLNGQPALLQRVAAVLLANHDHRQLSTDINAAWQVMHGVLAYGPDFTIQTAAGPQPAVEYLFAGGQVRGFRLRGGDRFEIDGQTVRGIVAEMDPGQKIGQGHRDQWLAYMARCGLQSSDVVVTADGPLTVAGWLRQMQWDIPLNFESEFSWTLTALLAHHPTTHRWTARDGNDYNIESLLQSELQQFGPDNACGGSHRLAAIAKAVRQRQAEGLPLGGVWASANTLVEMAMEQTEQFQNRDGSFSSQYFDRPGWSADWVTGLGTTGHLFEFLAIAGDDDLLGQPWVERAAEYLCDVLEGTSEIDLECGALYHALSGLAIYHQRLSATDGTPRSSQTADGHASTATHHTPPAE